MKETEVKIPCRMVQDRGVSAMLLPITGGNSHLSNQHRPVIRPSIHSGVLTIKFSVNRTPASSLHHCEIMGLPQGLRAMRCCVLGGGAGGMNGLVLTGDTILLHSLQYPVLVVLYLRVDSIGPTLFSPGH